MQFLSHNAGITTSSERRGRSRRRGSIAVIAAAGIVAFLGFCALSVDLGRAAATRNKLQRACDAAALAGAQNLPENPFEAKRIARKVAEINGAPGVLDSEITIYDNNTTIRVPAKQNIGYGFASVFNMRGATVVGAAVARVESASQAPADSNIVPIGITPDTFSAHPVGTVFQLDPIRQNKESLGLNELVLFDLRDSNGKSPHAIGDNYQRRVEGADQSR
jgi:Flp pilus assembly protein TadG